jgi:hypothetical protein
MMATTSMNQPQPDTSQPPQPKGSPHERTLMRVMVFGTSLSFGVLAAIAASMKDFLGGNATFEFSPRTLVAFVLGCLAGWVFWKLFRRWMNKKQSGST